MTEPIDIGLEKAIEEWIKSGKGFTFCKPAFRHGWLAALAAVEQAASLVDPEYDCSVGDVVDSILAKVREG